MTPGYRQLTAEEISVLRGQGCWAEDWRHVYVSERFTPECIVRVNFYGVVRLGVFSGSIALPGGISVHSGIYDATLFNVSVGDSSLIANIHGYIANYDIGTRTYITDVGKIYMEGVSAFGNGIKVKVMNEAGGRDVGIYTGMSSQAAYLSAVYRYRPGLAESFDAAVSGVVSRLSSDRGCIGSNVRIENVDVVRNVRIGNGAVLEGCLRLCDGTVASTDDAPVRMGCGIVCSGFIVQSGSVIEDGVTVSSSFIGQGVKLGRGFACTDSLFFADCHCENGEAVSVFAGPFTVSHHKATLLIGSMFSFMNAGSATNFSNHLYKLGPVHQGVFTRGAKFGSGAYMMLPVRTAPFTTVLGRHYGRIDSDGMPFSYIIESAGKSYLVPGANLKSSGLFRDMHKWPARDVRAVSGRIDHVIFDVFSPYTASAMIAGKDRLIKMLSEERFSGVPAVYGGCCISSPSLTKGAGRYENALKYYVGKKLADRLVDRKLGSDEAVREALAPESPVGGGSWVDIAGLLSPKAEIDNIVEEMAGGILDAAAVESRFAMVAANYSLYEWRWIYDHIVTVFGVEPGRLTRKGLKALLRQFEEAACSMFSEMEQDALKEFSSDMMTGFGHDEEGLALSDFRNVRGEGNSDPMVVALRASRQDISSLVRNVLLSL